MGLGRKGERVAKTPIRRFPPSLGGRTVGDHPPLSVAGEIPDQPNMRKPSSPRSMSGFRNAGSKTRKSPQLRHQPRLPGNAKFYWGSHCELWQSTFIEISIGTLLFSVSVIVKQLERKGCVFFAYALKGVHLKTD